MTDTISDYLRHNAVSVEPEHALIERSKLAEAADTIEALATQNEGYNLALVEQLQIRQQLETELDRCRAANIVADNTIEAQARENERLREALRQIERGSYPRPLGKPWRMDLSSSKHDRCIHDEWMYDTCEGCLDAFISTALGEQQ